MTEELVPLLKSSPTIKERLSSILSNLLLRAEDFVFGKMITTYRIDEDLSSQMSSYVGRYSNQWVITPVIKTERRKRAVVAVETFCYLAECYAFKSTSDKPSRRQSKYFGDFYYHRLEFKNFTDAVQEIHRYLEENSDSKEPF